MKNLRRALFRSVISLLLCFSMLLGTTYAWFTDSVTSTGNVIKSGSLDLKVFWTDDITDSDSWRDAEDRNAGAIFDYDRWEPGFTCVRYIKVVNNGDLAFKYFMNIIPDGEMGKLAEVIDVYYIDNYNVDQSGKLTSFGSMTKAGTLADVITKKVSNEGKVLPKDAENSGEVIFAIALNLPVSIGNEYQGTSVGGTFSIEFLATQYAKEEDSFGKDYDKNADYTVFTGDFVYSHDIQTANNVVQDETSAASENGEVTTKVNPGTKVKDGVSKLTVAVSTLDETSSNMEARENEVLIPVDVHVEGIADDNTVPVIVSLDKFFDPGLNLGNYELAHVENGVTNVMTGVGSLAELDAHNEYYYDPATGSVTVALCTFSEITAVRSVEAVWDGNVATVFAGGSGTETDPYLIANADQFALLCDVISSDNEAFTRAHYKLIVDINLGGEENAAAGKVFYPIGYHAVGGALALADLDDAPEFLYVDEIEDEGDEVLGMADYAAGRSAVSVASNQFNQEATWYEYGGAFMGTFDGDGHTIRNIYQNTWQLKGNYDGHYWNAAMGIFGYVYGGTVKNLTVENFTSDGEFTPTGVIAAYAAGGATFENIAIVDCNPRVYNTGNGGIVGIAGDTRVENDDHLVFRNITVDNSNKISALWGSWDVACGGLVGMYRGNVNGSGAATGDTIKFINCHVAAQIDVYNDVCANYQYYAYRYSGMLIGSVRHNENKDGHSYPAMAGISAENSTVHFGDWNDYYYCELVANTLASYTHDHQMSRLVQVAAVDTENMTVTSLAGETTAIPTSGRVNYVVVKNKNDDGSWKHGDGHNYADCYHFVNGVQHFHDVADADNPNIYETVGGVQVLKEDKQVVYREFNNLFTGYGWGVTSKGVGDLNGVTILDRTDGSSVVKFEGKVTELVETKTYKLGDIFSFENKGVMLVPDALTVSIVNKDEANPVSVKVVYDRENWENSTLVFSGSGDITITIQDYYYCIPTTIDVTIRERQPEEKFDVVMNNGNFLHRVGNVGTVALEKLFTYDSEYAQVGNVSVSVESVYGDNVGGTFSNNAVQFYGTGVVEVSIKDEDTYCLPTVLYLEVVDATNVTGLSGTISGNVVLLNDCGLSSLTVSGRNTVYGNGFTATYSGNGQYLNNGLKQGVITVSEYGTLDNLRVVATIYPNAYLYYGTTALGDYVQGGPSTTEGDKTRYHYQLSAIVAKGNATISNCYVYGGRTNIFMDTGDITVKDTVLECGTVANVQIQSNSDYTITLENVTTIQYLVDSNVENTTSQKILGAGVLVGPDTTSNPKIVLNGELKQYNWVTADDAGTISAMATRMIINGAVGATDYNHTINGKTASNLGIIYMNDTDVVVEDNTSSPYKLGDVSMSYMGQKINGQAYSLQNATAAQIYSDYENADRTTENGLYAPQFKYDAELGGQLVPDEGGDEHFYREGDTIHVMFPSGNSKEINLSALLSIVKYGGQDLTLVITCKDSNGNDVAVTDGKITLSAADTYTVTYTVTDTVFYDKDGNAITITGEVTYTFNVTIEVSLKDTAVPDAYFAFDSDKQKMGYYKPSFGDVKQYIPFLAGLKIYDYVGKEAYLRFDGDSDFNKVASITVTNKYSGNDALVVVKLTDGGVITLQLCARADSGGGSTYTGSIKTSNSVIYFVNDGGTSNKDSTTTAAYWYVDYYKFTGNNGVAIQSSTQTFTSSGKSASTPSGSFSTTIKYTVTYDANGGNCVQSLGYATSAATAVTLPTPTRSGYIFAGWYTAASGGTRVGGTGESYTPSANITLYAQWGKPCDVIYDANGGSCGTTSEKYTGTALTLPTPTRDGYWFLGWYDAAEGDNKIGDAGAKYNPAKEITLYAHWQEAIEYTVTYNANSGSVSPASATYEGTALTLPTPTRAGYTFNGWYTAASGGTKVGDAGATYIPSANITLYAQWQINSYTITVTTSNATVKVNGNTVNNNGTVSIQYGAQVTVEVTYSKSDSRSTTIKGADGTTYTSPFTMPAQNVTINATSKDSCVTGDTLVMLADGTEKRIDQVTTSDMLLVWNFFTGDYDVVPAAIIFYHGEDEYDVLNLHFADGTTVKVINDHGFYDVALDQFVFINADNVEFFMGHEFVKVDGDGRSSVALVGYETTKEYTGNYSIQTAVHINFIVEGMFSLTIPPFEGWFDYFEIGDGMKYDEEKMQADIETYGLYTYEEFADLVTYEQFMAFNGPYLKVLVGRGVVTLETIMELIATYVNP